MYANNQFKLSIRYYNLPEGKSCYTVLATGSYENLVDSARNLKDQDVKVGDFIIGKVEQVFLEPTNGNFFSI